jgi:hypothetical protein
MKLFGLLMLPVWIVCAVAYVTNIFMLVFCDFAPVGKEEVFRVVGLFFAPLGVVMGFFSHF